MGQMSMHIGTRSASYLRARYFYLELMFRRRAPEAPSPFPLREPTPSGPRSRAWRADRRGCRRSTGTRRRSRASRGATCRPAPRWSFPTRTSPHSRERITCSCRSEAPATSPRMPSCRPSTSAGSSTIGSGSECRINAFGLSTHAPDTTASQLYGRKSEAVSFSLSPSVGYKVNDGCPSAPRCSFSTSMRS